MTNKEISKIKLAITTACNLSCDYCFVKKTDQIMRLPTAKNAVTLLLNSPGQDKLLSIYGGEPLLNFHLMKQIIPYAQTLAEKKNKNIIVNICTNGILWQKAHLLFLKKHNVRLILSLVGKRPYQDRFRKFPDRKGTYDLIVKKLPLIFKIIPKDNLGVSFCIFPSTVDFLRENFQHLINLGFDHINFEIIREYEEWLPRQIKKFELSFKNLLNFVISNILKGQNIFINPISWELNYQTLTKNLLGYDCPFSRDLEVYPAGEIAFSPFVLNCANCTNYIIGNLAKNKFKKKYAECSLSWHPRCRTCRHDYFKHYLSDSGADKVSKIYRALCWQITQLIKKRAQKEIAFKRYLQEVARHKCF